MDSENRDSFNYLKTLRDKCNNEKGDLYDNGNCFSCSSLPIETLRKISNHLQIEVVDNFTPKDVLCVLIEDRLVKLNIKKEDQFHDLIRNEKGDVFLKSDPFGKRSGPGRSNIFYKIRNGRYIYLDSEVLKGLKETELYVSAHPEFREQWEEDLDLLFKQLVDPLKMPNGDLGYTKNHENILLQFGKWRLQRELINSLLSLKQVSPNVPKQIRMVISVMNLLRDCDNDESEWLSWKIFILAKMFNFDTNLSYKDMNQKGKLHYCQLIKQRVYMIQPKQLKSVIEQDIERELNKEKLGEKPQQERYIPKYLDYVGGHRSVPTVEEWRKRYKYEEDIME